MSGREALLFRLAPVAIGISLFAGCGSSSTAGTRERGPTEAAPAARTSAPTRAQNSTRAFQQRANGVCQAVRSAPAASAPSGPADARRADRGRDRAAVEATRAARTIEALLRLRPPAPLRARVGHLLSDLQRVERAYAAPDPQHGNHRAGSSPSAPLLAAEHEAQIAAATAGLPACFPPFPGP